LAHEARQRRELAAIGPRPGRIADAATALLSRGPCVERSRSGRLAENGFKGPGIEATMNPEQQLKFLGACLSLNPARHAMLVDALGGAPWPAILQRAGAHLVTPTLAGALDALGLTAQLPGDVQAYLQAVRDLNRTRNTRLFDELVRVAETLNGIGITPQLLKGAATLLPELYPGAADRMIGDLDLKVPAERYMQAATAVHGLGYRYAEGYAVLPGAYHHGAPLLHPSEPFRVELHQRSLLAPNQNTALESGMRVQIVTLPDTDVQVSLADPGTRLLHNFLHQQIQDSAHVRHYLTLRQLLEFARIFREHRATLDCSALSSRLQWQHRHAFRVYLLAAEHWLGESYPASLKRPLAGRLTLQLITFALSRRYWYVMLGIIGRMRNLPGRLVTPWWYGMKVEKVRRGEPW
jgi:hypothetical protein